MKHIILALELMSVHNRVFGTQIEADQIDDSIRFTFEEGPITKYMNGEQAFLFMLASIHASSSTDIHPWEMCRQMSVAASVIEGL
jgi:hypothetical protein